MAPDFTAWTITHTHKVKIMATIVHRDSGHQFKMETKFPFKVLPPDQSAPLAPVPVPYLNQSLSPGVGEEGGEERGEDEAEEPPAYDAKENVSGDGSDVKAGPSKQQ